MATYFHGAPEIQPDGLQTLYLMNPGFVGYSEPPAPPANMVFLNPMSTSHGVEPNQQQHFVGVPLHAAAVPSQDADRFSSIHSSHEISAIQGLVPRLHYNLLAPPLPNNPMDLSSQLGLRRPSVVPSTQQGLSLSLSPQQTQYDRYRPQPETPAPVAEITLASAEEAMVPGTSSPLVSAAPNGISGMQSVLMGSNYLKVAQQLLDEVAYAGTGINGQPPRRADSMNQGKPNIDGDHPDATGTDTKQGAELTAAERQELQMKKAKLVSMLDEVEQRYRQYHHQMQIVVSWFESAAGFGSARTYTALALQTISKQFRCLRDAISGQIRATSRSLGDEDCSGGARSQEPRLRSVDHHLRQQRALQQLAMMQHNAWRPQRGLPERAVSVLRAWLFEHFLHPYPKDSDKLILAKQTGLTRSQVSNWFINARVRLWKPMVEEMYLEETKEQEQNNQGERTSKSDANEEDSMSKSSARQENSPAIGDQTDPQLPPITIPPHNGSYNDGEALMQHKIKKARSDESLHPNTVSHSMMNEELRSTERSNQEMLMSFGDERRRSEGNHGYSLISTPGDHGGGFGAYSIGEIGRFDQQQFTPRFLGNGVSLTLGLQHYESLSLSGSQPAYLSSESIPMGRRDEMSGESNGYRRSLSNIPPVTHASNSYEAINIQSRKRFDAQLLPDFVA